MATSPLAPCLARLWHTIRPLGAAQFFYRAWYPLKNLWWQPRKIPGARLLANARAFRVAIIPPAVGNDRYDADTSSFILLNKKVSFPAATNWDYRKEGLLWAYHLHYFQWLDDDLLSVAERRSILTDYAARGAVSGIAQAAYPLSLRIIYCTGFAAQHGLQNDEVLMMLYAGALRLAAFPERHLQANHLLENGFGLYHAACLFKDNYLLAKASCLLTTELNRQILPDGGHYERSAGYHSLLLAHLLRCIGLEATGGAMHVLLREKAQQMLGWLCAYCFAGGSPAHFGDSNEDMGTPLHLLVAHAAALGIQAMALPALRESGYRKLSVDGMELIINAGNPSPAHQPGHSHADPLSFVLCYQGTPIITEAGCSTYQPGQERQYERSTAAHNTIVLNHENASDVWKTFRMGRRAKVTIKQDEAHILDAYHDGWRRFGIIHRRTFKTADGLLTIEDALQGRAGSSALSHLHFHPDVNPIRTGTDTFTAGGLRIVLENYSDVHLRTCQHAEGFNKIRPGICLSGHVQNQSSLHISPLPSSC